MDQLYSLRKRLRKLRDENTSASAAAGGGTREPQLAELRRAIEDLSVRLPVAALRHDLRVHYDAFLSEINGSSSGGDGGAPTSATSSKAYRLPCRRRQQSSEAAQHQY